MMPRLLSTVGVLLACTSSLLQPSKAFITLGRFSSTPSVFLASHSSPRSRSSSFPRLQAAAYGLVSAYNDSGSSFACREQYRGSVPVGSITLVGAGPGDPDLLTVGAVKALESSSALVIADRLIAPEILSLVKGELLIANKHPGCAERAQQEIYSWVWEAISQGRDVVRLKIGDPFLFGRGGEEVLQFRQFGVEPKVIPGVSSAFAAPLLSSIPVTHRNVANQVYICTGYGKDGDRPYLAPYFKNQTAVFLMAVGRLGELCNNLVNVGYPSTTPVAILEKASTPQQRTISGTISTIVDIAEREKAKAPAVIVVGEVVNVLREDEQHKQVEEEKNQSAYIGTGQRIPLLRVNPTAAGEQAVKGAGRQSIGNDHITLG